MHTLWLVMVAYVAAIVVYVAVWKVFDGFWIFQIRSVLGRRAVMIFVAPAVFGALYFLGALRGIAEEHTDNMPDVFDAIKRLWARNFDRSQYL